MSFSMDISDFVKRANIKVETVCRKIALDVFTGVVEMTPVKTGLAKNNWFPSLNSPSIETTTATGSSTPRAAMAAMGWSAKRPLFLVNNLPYIQRLENGSSTQAPAGMVKVTLARFQSIVQGAAT